MDTVLNILVFLSLATVVAILFAGLFTMARGGQKGPERSNRFMRYRVIAQAVALLVLVIALLAKGA